MNPAELITAESGTGVAEQAIALAAPFFDPIESLGGLTPVAFGDLPADDQTLLAHGGHMTTTLEAWHESLVDVRVVAEKVDQLCYARHSLLTRSFGTGGSYSRE